MSWLERFRRPKDRVQDDAGRSSIDMQHAVPANPLPKNAEGHFRDASHAVLYLRKYLNDRRRTWLYKPDIIQITQTEHKDERLDQLQPGLYVKTNFAAIELEDELIKAAYYTIVTPDLIRSGQLGDFQSYAFTVIPQQSQFDRALLRINIYDIPH